MPPVHHTIQSADTNNNSPGVTQHGDVSWIPPPLQPPEHSYSSGVSEGRHYGGGGRQLDSPVSNLLTTTTPAYYAGVKGRGKSVGLTEEGDVSRTSPLKPLEPPQLPRTKNIG